METYSTIGTSGLIMADLDARPRRAIFLFIFHTPFQSRIVCFSIDVAAAVYRNIVLKAIYYARENMTCSGTLKIYKRWNLITS